MKDFLNGAMKSWTMWFNFLMLNIVWILPAAESVLPELKDMLPENVYAYLFAVLALGNKVLRVKTTMSLAEKAVNKQ